LGIPDAAVSEVPYPVPAALFMTVTETEGDAFGVATRAGRVVPPAGALAGAGIGPVRVAPLLYVWLVTGDGEPLRLVAAPTPPPLAATAAVTSVGTDVTGVCLMGAVDFVEVVVGAVDFVEAVGAVDFVEVVVGAAEVVEAVDAVDFVEVVIGAGDPVVVVGAAEVVEGLEVVEVVEVPGVVVGVTHWIGITKVAPESA
jgi:hypothetical protein